MYSWYLRLVIHSKDFQNGVMENLYNFAIEWMAAWPYMFVHISFYVNRSTLLSKRCPTDISTRVWSLGALAKDGPVRDEQAVAVVSHPSEVSARVKRTIVMHALMHHTL